MVSFYDLMTRLPGRLEGETVTLRDASWSATSHCRVGTPPTIGTRAEKTQ